MGVSAPLMLDLADELDLETKTLRKVFDLPKGGK